MDSSQIPTTKSTTLPQQIRHLNENKAKRNEGPQHQGNFGEGAKEDVGVFPITTLYSIKSLCHTPAQVSTENTMQIPTCLVESYPQLQELMQQSTLNPPCTPATLRELDLQSIQNNLNLRIDICFDHDLFFQPISGRKGDAKRIEAEKYWLSLAAEFRIYQHQATPDCQQCGGITLQQGVFFERRLPTLFANLKEIVEMLVPVSEHEEVANHLDVNLLMQQVERGALDIPRLTDWLTGLLTSHCAPMRDCVAKEVTTDILNGTAQADAQLLVRGIEKLFGLLEAMKLDIANHQIRAFRYPLIEDAVSFQQDCFARAIETCQTTVSSSKIWYQRMCFDHEHDCISVGHDCTTPAFRSFIHAMVRLCDPGIKRVPTTFRYDQQRFTRLQEDLQDLVQIDLCLIAFKRRISQLVGDALDPSGMFDTLKSRIIYLTEDEDGNGGAISDHLGAIGLEITQAIFTTVGEASRQSNCINDIELGRTDQLLHQLFEEEAISGSGTNRFLSSLEQRTMKFAQDFLPMTTLEVSSAQRQWSHARSNTHSGKESLLADWDDMARRLAHIGVLHWRVWADLCYLKDDQLDDSDFFADTESMISTPTSYNSSPFTSPQEAQQPFPGSREATITAQVSCTKQNRIDSNFSECIEDSDGVLEQGTSTDLAQDIDMDKGDNTSSM